MNLYQIAELTVAIACSEQILLRQAAPYRTDSAASADIVIDGGDARLQAAWEKHPHLTLDEWEYIRTGAIFSDCLLQFGGFCLHAAAVALDGRAVLFSAPCGVGKSTQASLWRQRFGDERVTVINDDKPAVRRLDGQFYVYGTPWSGKTDLNSNLKVPLQAVVYLEQAAENQIRLMSSREAAPKLLQQSLHFSKEREQISRLLGLLDELLTEIPVYLLQCTISQQAVQLAHDQVFGRE